MITSGAPDLETSRPKRATPTTAWLIVWTVVILALKSTNPIKRISSAKSVTRPTLPSEDRGVHRTDYSNNLRQRRQQKYIYRSAPTPSSLTPEGREILHAKQLSTGTRLSYLRSCQWMHKNPPLFLLSFCLTGHKTATIP